MANNDAASAAHQTLADSEDFILQSRARSLALPSAETADADYIEIIAFILADETYGIETSYVNEVHSLNELTPLPCTPPFVAGIINVHGQVFSVIDIKVFFELPTKGLSDLNKVIIISNGDMEFGILADAILDVRHIPPSELQPTLPTLTGIREDFLRGISKDRLVVLDAFSLLTDPNIIVNEEVE